MLSRLLYTNPVCLLITRRRRRLQNCVDLADVAAELAAGTAADDQGGPGGGAGRSSSMAGREETGRAGAALSPAGPGDATVAAAVPPAPNLNVMTITWLTPVNNRGLIVLSMNKRRFTASLLFDGAAADRRFTLSVPVAGMEELVRCIGGCSGADGDKVANLDVGVEAIRVRVAEASAAVAAAAGGGAGSTEVAAAGATDERKRAASKTRKAKAERFPLVDESDVYVRGCCAAMVCVVRSAEDASYEGDDEHVRIVAQVERGFVLANYWDGKCFLVKDPLTSPPYLSFVGSGRFAKVVP